MFGKIAGFPPKRNIEFSIELIHRVSPISKNIYRMSTLELKELQMYFEELLNKGYIHPSLSPWGVIELFLKKKNGTLRICIYC
jgi:hypothetical protein